MRTKERKNHRTHCHAVLLIAVLCSLPATSVHAGTIGQDLIDHSLQDTAAGSIFAYNSESFPASEMVTSWSVYSDVGGVVTPLIFEMVGGEYIIRGVGTSRTSDASGIQTFDFDVTAGSAMVQPGYLLGWKDGTDADATQTGVIDLEIGAPSTGDYQWFVGGHSGDLTDGSNLGVGVNLIGTYGQVRDYSVQFTTIPEPSACVLLGLGMLSLLGYTRRRR